MGTVMRWSPISFCFATISVKDATDSGEHIIRGPSGCGVNPNSDQHSTEELPRSHSPAQTRTCMINRFFRISRDISLFELGHD